MCCPLRVNASPRLQTRNFCYVAAALLVHHLETEGRTGNLYFQIPLHTVKSTRKVSGDEKKQQQIKLASFEIFFWLYVYTNICSAEAQIQGLVHVR